MTPIIDLKELLEEAQDRIEEKTAIKRNAEKYFSPIR